MPTYSENLRTETEPLKIDRRFTKFIFHSRPECFEPGYEWEWDRVQRMRKEDDPLIKGGHYREVHLMPTYHFKHRDKLSQRKFHILNSAWDR